MPELEINYLLLFTVYCHREHVFLFFLGQHFLEIQYCPFKVVRNYMLKFISACTYFFLCILRICKIYFIVFKNYTPKVFKHTWRIRQKYLSVYGEYCGFRAVPLYVVFSEYAKVFWRLWKIRQKYLPYMEFTPIDINLILSRRILRQNQKHSRP